MSDLLTHLLQANLAAAAAIVAVLILRKSVRKSFGAKIAYGLWLLVPLVAGASLAPPRPAEFLPPVAPAPLVQAAEQTAEALWTWSSDVAPAGVDPTPIAVALWLLGLLLAAGWLAWRQSQFLLLLRHGEAGPAVVGFLRPRIVTPSDFEQRFDRREQTVVLAHEKIHLARHDARINAAVSLARCVCWFNPMIHVAAHLMRVDQELSCDAAVVERHPKARAPYAQALLKAQLAAKPLPLGCYWPAGTEHPLTERIAMLKRSNPSAVRRVSGGALIAVLSAGASYAAWAATPATSPAVQAPLAYVEEALTPKAEPPALQTPPTAKSPTSAAADEPAPASTAPPAEVCASNACAEVTIATPPSPPINRVTYVGSALLPAAQPFVKYFDGNSPVSFKGRVAEVHMTDGMAAEMLVQGEDGKLYRVIGGNPANLPPESRAQIEALPGATIDVRGYLGHDKTCEGGCLVNGWATFLDGSPVMTRPPG